FKPPPATPCSRHHSAGHDNLLALREGRVKKEASTSGRRPRLLTGTADLCAAMPHAGLPHWPRRRQTDAKRKSRRDLPPGAGAATSIRLRSRLEKDRQDPLIELKPTDPVAMSEKDVKGVGGLLSGARHAGVIPSHSGRPIAAETAAARWESSQQQGCAVEWPQPPTSAPARRGRVEDETATELRLKRRCRKEEAAMTVSIRQTVQPAASRRAAQQTKAGAKSFTEQPQPVGDAIARRRYRTPPRLRQSRRFRRRRIADEDLIVRLRRSIEPTSFENGHAHSASRVHDVHVVAPSGATGKQHPDRGKTPLSAGQGSVLQLFEALGRCAESEQTDPAGCPYLFQLGGPRSGRVRRRRTAEDEDEAAQRLEPTSGAIYFPAGYPWPGRSHPATGTHGCSVLRFSPGRSVACRKPAAIRQCDYRFGLLVLLTLPQGAGRGPALSLASRSSNLLGHAGIVYDLDRLSQKSHVVSRLAETALPGCYGLLRSHYLEFGAFSSPLLPKCLAAGAAHRKHVNALVFEPERSLRVQRFDASGQFGHPGVGRRVDSSSWMDLPELKDKCITCYESCIRPLLGCWCRLWDSTLPDWCTSGARSGANGCHATTWATQQRARTCAPACVTLRGLRDHPARLSQLLALSPALDKRAGLLLTEPQRGHPDLPVDASLGPFEIAVSKAQLGRFRHSASTSATQCSSWKHQTHPVWPGAAGSRQIKKQCSGLTLRSRNRRPEESLRDGPGFGCDSVLGWRPSIEAGAWPLLLAQCRSSWPACYREPWTPLRRVIAASQSTEIGRHGQLAQASPRHSTLLLDGANRASFKLTEPVQKRTAAAGGAAGGGTSPHRGLYVVNERASRTASLQGDEASPRNGGSASRHIRRLSKDGGALPPQAGRPRLR
uniref:ULP_PROTEASE domain-containing protein n=1 Tax=Macrostomum lignano TaxID=282301 RepID=A0A1I8F658_9PLAT